ncbi:MAG: right-handed parallel beta-helix repeat-containing protein, partial [Cyanobacteria bacterium P01_A01_bin.135]
GVAIAGVGRPVVEGNRIYQNRGNGISVSDTAAPLIRTNRIEETGYGVVVRDRAVPRLLENYISGNRSGVVVQGRSRPVLRQNHITGNHQDGVVALAEAQPDLGTQGQAGENQFDSNGGYAINAEASDEIIAAAGNHFTAPNPAERLAGRIDLHGVVGDAVSLGTPPDAPGRNSQSIPSAASPPIQLAVIPAADIPSPANSRPTVAQQPLRPSPQRSMAAETVAMRTVAVAAPRRAIPPRNPNLLPVPASSVPVGYAGSRAAISATGGGRRPRYRVLVDVYSRREQALVEAIAPEAFITRINGRMAMQAGAYYQAENANQMLQQLTRTGLRAEVQQMR